MLSAPPTGANLGRARASARMSTKEQEPKRIWWARPGKLCGLERPGEGGGATAPSAGRPRSPTCRARACACASPRWARATTWARTSCAGLEWHHVPVESAQRGAEALEELLPLLRRELRRRGAVAVHGDRHTDFVAAVCAAHLHEARGVDPAEALAGRPRRG